MAANEIAPAAYDADRAEAAVRAWLESNLGEIVSFKRQGRWRPGWEADVRHNGKVLPLYVRGNRIADTGTVTAATEGKVLTVMEAHGIPVPHVYGEIPEADAVVMDMVPGRANLATAESEAERASVMDHYMELLAQIHAIDPAEFGNLIAQETPSPEDLALVYFDRFEARYRETKRRPEPFLEFAIQWLRRNRPTHRNKASFVLGDPAQFLFADGRVTGVIDVELFHLGDVYHDLGGLRLRDVTEPLGDINRALDRYAEVTGEAIEPDLVEFHTAQFGLSVPLSLTGIVHSAPPIPDMPQYIEWFHQNSLVALDAISFITGIDLGEVETQEPVGSEFSAIVAALPGIVADGPAEDGFGAYRSEMLTRYAHLAERVGGLGAAMVAADLADMKDTLGIAASDWADGDAKLEAFVLDAPPEGDEELIRLMYRRIMRRLALIEPTMSMPGGIHRIAPAA